ncbi:MAG TPA: hypothetical protein VIJ71_04970, partial [Mycobacteriales bacterium]
MTEPNRDDRAVARDRDDAAITPDRDTDLRASEIDLGGGLDFPDRTESDLLAGLALEQRQGL